LSDTFSTPVRTTLDQTAAVPSRTAAVLEAIKHAILAGELVPGQALVETELAAKLGVSKTPVREALKTLAGVGLVIMSPYKGASVRAVDEELAQSIFDMRLLLEPEAVRRATRLGGDLSGARHVLDQAAQAADAAERSLANREFHRLMYAPCGNPLLVKALDDLRDQTALVSAAAWKRTPSWADEADEHEAILAAALTGDAERAAHLLSRHIESFFHRNFPDLALPPG
jgi:DNA-binding GntR family transcriptional regulator